MTAPASTATLFEEPERHPLRPSEAARALGPTVVVAPHPDDEALGCGGLLALLAAAGAPAWVVFVTDGTRSHPNSPSYPPPRLRTLREAEALAALAALGLPADHAVFLRHPDCGIPAADTPAFAAAAEGVAALLRRLDVETVVVPWRRDPHCDHVATWALLRAAVAALPAPPRWLEYAVWAWTRPAEPVAPRADEAAAWRLDVGPVLAQKRAAVAAHRSQTTGLIADDPGGFRLSPDVLRLFERPWELYLEPADAAAGALADA